MTPPSMPPDVEEELAPIRKTIDNLSAFVTTYTAPQFLEASNPAVLAASDAYDEALKELEPFGFTSLGYVGWERKDGSLSVSRWIAQPDDAICGWIGLLTAKDGKHLVMFLASETSLHGYCTTTRSPTALSLALPPNVTHGHHAMSASLSDVARAHRDRVHSLKASGISLTPVSTRGEAIDIMERLHNNRMTWRASVPAQDMLRQDFMSILALKLSEWGAKDFRLTFPLAAEWFGFLPAEATLGDHVSLAPGPLTDLLALKSKNAEAEQGSRGVESDWLLHSEFKLQGTRLQMLDVFMAGNDDEGVILDASPGLYIVEARVITYGTDRRISRVRVYPKAQVVTQGELAGKVDVDLAAVAICDVDRLASWAKNDEDEWQRWGQKLWFDRTAAAGLYTCEPASTVVAFVDSGFGDSTYPVYYLMHDGQRVGLEAEFISPETPYLRMR